MGPNTPPVKRMLLPTHCDATHSVTLWNDFAGSVSFDSKAEEKECQDVYAAIAGLFTAYKSANAVENLEIGNEYFGGSPPPSPLGLGEGQPRRRRAPAHVENRAHRHRRFPRF